MRAPAPRRKGRSRAGGVGYSRGSQSRAARARLARNRGLALWPLPPGAHIVARARQPRQDGRTSIRGDRRRAGARCSCSATMRPTGCRRWSPAAISGCRRRRWQRHIAYDIGARGVTLELARLMRAPALLTCFSRLVIDPNRGEDDPTLVMRLYDGTIIPANRHVTPEEVEAAARRLAPTLPPGDRRRHRADRRRRAAAGAGLDPLLHPAAQGPPAQALAGRASSGTTTGGWRGRCSRGCGRTGSASATTSPIRASSRATP